MVGESLEEVTDILEECKEAFKGNILRKTRIYRIIEYEFREREHRANKKKQAMMLSRDVVGELERFNYLRSVLQKNYGFEKDI